MGACIPSTTAKDLLPGGRIEKLLKESGYLDNDDDDCNPDVEMTQFTALATDEEESEHSNNYGKEYQPEKGIDGGIWRRKGKGGSGEGQGEVQEVSMDAYIEAQSKASKNPKRNSI